MSRPDSLWRGVSAASLTAIVGWLGAEAVATAVGAPEGVRPLSPVLFAILTGILWRNLAGLPSSADSGVAWMANVALKTGIALTGLRLTLAGASAIATIAVPVVIGCIAAVVLVGAVLARTTRIPRRLLGLLTVGTAVCGCTAVVAVAPVIRARPAETAFALTCVILLGCLGMLVYPWLAAWLFEDAPVRAGIFLGAAIHDTSQVIGSSLIYAQQQGQPEALAAASVTKFIRNAFIAVALPVAACLAGPRRRPGHRAPVARRDAFPAFVVGFLACVALRSAGDFMLAAGGVAPYWKAFVSLGIAFSEGLLMAGMAAVGLGVSLAGLGRLGGRPVLATIALAISAFAAAAVLAYPW